MATIFHNEQLLVDLDRDISNIIKEVGAEALLRVEERTPVDTGYARSRWQLSVDGDSFSLMNDAEYISFLELGSSNQAPTGMLGITMMEVPSIVDDIVAKYKKD